MMAAGAVVPKKLALENEAWSRVDDFPKPTIAAVSGLAFGGGLELAVCCDLIVAEEGARVALPEIKLGVFPGSGGTIRVTRRIGEGRAKEMMFFGEPVPVETALAWGLVNRVVPKGEALAAAIEMARRLAAQPSVALQMCKRAVDLAFDYRRGQGRRGLARHERHGVRDAGLRRGRARLLRQGEAAVQAPVRGRRLHLWRAPQPLDAEVRGRRPSLEARTGGGRGIGRVASLRARPASHLSGVFLSPPRPSGSPWLALRG